MENKRMQRPDGNNRNNKFKFSWTWIYLVLAAVLIGYYFLGGHSNTRVSPINDLELKQLVLDKDVAKAVYVQKDEKVMVYLKKESIDAKGKFAEFQEKNLDGPHYSLEQSDYKAFKDEMNEWISAECRRRAADSVATLKRLAADTAVKSPMEIPDREVIADNLYDEYRFSVEQDNSKAWGGELLLWFFPVLLMVLLFVMMFRSMRGGVGGGVFNIGKSKAQVYDSKTAQGVSFKDVAGLEGAKEEVEEIVDFLKNPKKYTVLGGKIPKGALLVGPPGTGKTLLAKAVAGEAKVPFFSLSGSDFVEMFVGVGASRVRDLFKTAKEKAPCIIFIDEIDAIGRARGRNAISGANDERENTLNQLLTEMDGFSTNAGVIILAATNRADILDRALLRAGRFDRQIHVELPNLNERKGIFQVHVRNLKLDSDVDLDFFAKQTPGFSGADIANVCNEAALVAARNAKASIGKEDFLAAIDRIIGGLEKRSSIISPQEKRVIAYHESGHATVSWLLKHASPLVKVTIVPRGKALGAAWYLPEERQLTTFEQMFDEMCTLVAGRASEEVIFGEVSTGALNDLERVTKMAYAMVAYYGLNKSIGNLSYYDSTGQSDYAFQRPYSEKTAEEIDKQVHELVESAYTKAKDILETHKDQLNVLAQILIDKEVIFADDLEKIYGKRPASALDTPDNGDNVSDEKGLAGEATENDKQDKSYQDGKE